MFIKIGGNYFFSLLEFVRLPRAEVFYLFHTVAHFLTQGNLATHFGQQRPSRRKIIVFSKKKSSSQVQI